jgi:hypothetical protein
MILFETSRSKIVSKGTIYIHERINKVGGAGHETYHQTFDDALKSAGFIAHTVILSHPGKYRSVTFVTNGIAPTPAVMVFYKKGGKPDIAHCYRLGCEPGFIYVQGLRRGSYGDCMLTYDEFLDALTAIGAFTERDHWQSIFELQEQKNGTLESK